MPLYDGMIKDPEYYRDKKHVQFDIVLMHPYDYLQGAGDIFSMRSEDMGTPRRYSLADVLNVGVSEENVKKISDKMSKGTKYHMPVLDLDALEQEGRHRAIAADDLGIAEIPVMVVYPA